MPAFLSGCWEQRTEAGRWTEECWTDTRGGLMIGSGRDGNGDQVGHWEWMRIERGADGAVTFYGSPKGAPAVGFKATEADGKSITFVNASPRLPAASPLCGDRSRPRRRSLARRRQQAQPVELSPYGGRCAEIARRPSDLLSAFGQRRTPSGECGNSATRYWEETMPEFVIEKSMPGLGRLSPFQRDQSVRRSCSTLHGVAPDVE